MKYIDTENLENKKVILRCDYNVPIKDGKIVDDSRIVRSLETLNYLIRKNCSIIILSHLGRVNTREDMINNSLAPVAERLSQLINKPVKFLSNPVGMDVLSAAKELHPRDVMMLENTRFCDYPEKLESHNDLNIAKYWSSLADVFVIDAFGSLHRAHASVAGISKFLPTYYGLLVKEEMEGLTPVVNVMNKPFGVFMGGAKVDDKLKYIKDILPKCDYLLIGGGIANSFLYAMGYDVQDSLCTSDQMTLQEIRDLISVYKDRIITPVDFKFNGTMIYDLGEKSIAKYSEYLAKCKTIFINGTCGKFEEEGYSKGTITLFSSLNPYKAYIAAGGGDTLNAINTFGLGEHFNFMSTGGGASLEYVSTGHLEGVDYIESNTP